MMNDILKDTDGDMLIANNDIVVGYSDQQQREDLLIVEKGSIKQFPGVGVGAFTFLEAEDPDGAALLREIALQFSADGMDVQKITIDGDGNILPIAPYK